MKKIKLITGQLAETSNDLESLWQQAASMGSPSIDRSIGTSGYRASIQMHTGDMVRSDKGLTVHQAMAQAIHKARVLGGAI